MGDLLKKRPAGWTVQLGAIVAFALLAVVVVPLLNQAGVIADYRLNLWGKYLCYAVLAVSLNLLWGYTGLLCLGQCLFFSLGGYAIGMHLMLIIEKTRCITAHCQTLWISSATRRCRRTGCLLRVSGLRRLR